MRNALLAVCLLFSALAHAQNPAAPPDAAANAHNVATAIRNAHLPLAAFLNS